MDFSRHKTFNTEDMKTFFQKQNTGNNIGTYTSQSDRGKLANSVSSSENVKHILPTGYLAVPDENSPVFANSFDGDPEPFAIGEVHTEQMKNAEGAPLLQGERVIYSTDKSSEIYMRKTGEITIRKYKEPWTSYIVQDGKKIPTGRTYESKQYAIDIDPNNDKIEITLGQATLSGVTAEKHPRTRFRMDGKTNSMYLETLDTNGIVMGSIEMLSTGVINLN
jgi:hypothetical protein